MRFSYRCLVVFLVLALCLQLATAAPHAALRRQEQPPAEASPAPTQATASQQPSQTPSPSEVPSSRIESDAPLSTSASSVKPSEAPSTTSNAPSTSASGVPSPTSSASPASANPLPIVPTLTPAMGITGVILLLSGLAYAIIGIKKKMVYVFGSAAYLTALAVTVLVVYLMNAPVSNAVQGAFFVAAFFTGVIFGVLSLVFADISEGFGCLLGGFCLSMWFLSLKEGGLISSSTGRAIFIGCMTAGGYSLSFSHYTRNYGLIASIAFSGATATILGIDCLAGSGWKEFWLYIWNLNDNIFPLNTTTYPLTKNMKAELAGVVIIALAGIVSQMRVWKIVKEHRTKTAAQQLERQQDLDREEEERGRKVEDNFQKERAQWEAAYGNGQNPEDSSSQSSLKSPKVSAIVQEKEVPRNDSMEMLANQKKGAKKSAKNKKQSDTTVPVNVPNDDAIQQIDAEGNPTTSEQGDSVSGSRSNGTASPASDGAPRPILTKRSSLRPSAPPPPPSVVPLPFKVPDEDDSLSNNDNTSVSAVPESEAGSSEARRMSKRISDVSAMRQRISHDIGARQAAMTGAGDVEDDGASSVAATLDDDLDVLSARELSRAQSPIGTERDELASEGTGRQDSDTVPSEASSDVAQDEQRLPTVAVSRQSLTISTNPKNLVSSSEASSVYKNSKSSSPVAPSHGSQTEQGGSQFGSLKDGVLPQRMSKIALSYRTNEWAKHLESAEKPDYEDTFMPSSPGVMLANGSEELPAPISEELAAPLVVNKRDSRSSAGSKKRSSSHGLQRNSSQTSLARGMSNTQSPPIGSLSRSSSATRLDVLSPLPSNTLLGKRESLIKNRATSLTLTRSSSALADRGDEENMTLAQRRQLLQQQPIESPLTSPRKAPPSTGQKWQSKPWAAKGAPAGFDSHQPRRTSNAQSDQRREQLYSGWRDNMRDATPSQPTVNLVEQQRIALMNEKRQKEMEKQQRELIQQQRASQMDSMMRSGHMMDAHREAMRKLQANANKHA
ncbi:hypothetical protein PTNB73_00101 [Pyrenophora teres f. teres]|uniref:TM7S3/TM198-like domain-containing protein n=2 Tax=Pyrenophora teres f. teres TaxID=97479 RepID=E3S077_PYRTT|nr:hypothetical protein PTT_15440 [Pyrenophora teres f. teres 0-1]KAE8842048.1 hypothetical protein HRS9139_01345 [Pyrenophora teres f. teres]KAE8850884.1 hypothetical protein PTNB85_01300 [Pyrenophora teres f. teres]KAE8851084.1 hypothetical protein HRS9122_01371 [Pyrenophora teres f. teres]KAE8869757.1 hypothetical protein PTNB29_00101 [Pyrenophora teres f. teres]